MNMKAAAHVGHALHSLLVTARGAYSPFHPTLPPCLAQSSPLRTSCGQPAPCARGRTRRWTAPASRWCRWQTWCVRLRPCLSRHGEALLCGACLDDGGAQCSDFTLVHPLSAAGDSHAGDWCLPPPHPATPGQGARFWHHADCLLLLPRLQACRRSTSAAPPAPAGRSSRRAGCLAQAAAPCSSWRLQAAWLRASRLPWTLAPARLVGGGRAGRIARAAAAG